MVSYLDTHAAAKASAVQVRIAARYIGEWWMLRSLAEITPRTQREFIQFSGKKNLAPSSIRRYLTTLSAALRHSVKSGVLTVAPQIVLSESQLGEQINAPGSIKPRRLTIEEIALFLDAVKSPYVWRYILLALNTLARPDAITDIAMPQVKDGLIDLNPAGRRQTKKYRPIIPATPTIADWLHLWQEDGPIVHYKGKAIGNPRKAIHDTAVAAGLITAEEAFRPDRAVTPYTFRRTMGRMLRAEGVPMADIGGMMGHAIPGVSTTEIYADADPNYLSTVKSGIEAILTKVAAHVGKAPVRVGDLGCDQIATKWITDNGTYLGHKWPKALGFPRAFDGGRYKD